MRLITETLCVVMALCYLVAFIFILQWAYGKPVDTSLIMVFAGGGCFAAALAYMIDCLEEERRKK